MSDSEGLEAAFRLLADKEAIRACVHRYARGIDRHDEEILRTVFHEDAVDNHGDATNERDAFIRWGNEWHENVSIAHTHCMTSHFSDVDGDEAHAVTYVIFTLCRKDGVTIHVGGGRYMDRLFRRDGAWRIVVRRITIDWRFDTGRYAPSDALAGLPRGRWDRTDPSYAVMDR